MPKYIMVYKLKQPFDMSDMPEEEVKKVMEVWGEWLGSMGDKVVDEGDAFKADGKSVAADGVSDADNLTSGYTIIEAKDYDEALECAQSSPHLQEGDGATVEVYEAFGL